ncbi:MAG: DUF86 domain-containing protein [Candidatus Moraniibacteriota bacterium]
MINRELVQRKINNIENYIKEIEPLLKLEANEIVSDVLKLRTIERNFQLIVDTMLDINTHIISAKNLKAPETLQETFLILGDGGVLPFEFVKKIAPVVGLRNIVVHEYEKIDNEKMMCDVKDGASQFGEYIVHIDDFLQKYN